SRGVINGMVNFPLDKRFILIKIESLSKDIEMNSLRAAFLHLDFTDEEIVECLDIAAKNCIWNIGRDAIGKHATTGMSDDWQSAFKGEVEIEYRRLFGGAEEALGYF
ncbi:MAG: hypothetical protein V1816_14705, partial [Pseudomonadota bacterium]